MNKFNDYMSRNAMSVWEQVDKINLDAEYEWKVGPKAQSKLAQLLKLEMPLQRRGEGSMALNRRIRTHVREVLHSPATTKEHAADLYKWIVGDWGGIRNGLDTVAGWASPETGWHGKYDDRILLAFADAQGNNRLSSFTKVFAYASPDEHAIYDSRVAVCLNIALHKLNAPWRFFMPASRNTHIIPVRKALGGDFHGGYREYLTWAKAVRSATGTSLHDIEATLFAVAPDMAVRF